MYRCEGSSFTLVRQLILLFLLLYVSHDLFTMASLSRLLSLFEQYNGILAIGKVLGITLK